MDVAPPSTRQRLLAAIVIGILAGGFAWLSALRQGAVPDFLYPYTAARLFLDGQNPYVVMTGHPGATAPFDGALFYPFTTVLAVLPLARLQAPTASAVFFGASSALLAFFVTRHALWRVHLFASAPFVVAAILGQFSPLLMVMAFAPVAGFLAAVKPNLGLVLFVRRPSVHIVIGSFAALAVSLLVFPQWPVGWLATIGNDLAGRQTHAMPVRELGGPLLLLSAIAWRLPEGRLLLAMSLVPQGLFFYDQLLLWLIPRTRNESIALTAASQAAMLLWYLTIDEGDPIVFSSYPFIMLLVYFPALVLVLRHWGAGSSPVLGTQRGPGS